MDDIAERCEHGIRYPHECDDCSEEALKPHNLVAKCLEYQDTIQSLQERVAVLEGALRPCVDYMQFRKTAHSEPAPLARALAALGDTNGQD